MFDKTARLPPAGSLREALFLTIWLRRSHAEALRLKVIAAGLMRAGEGDGSEVQKNFDLFLETIFPFNKKERSAKDSEMVDTMKREVAKGAVSFQMQDLPNPFRDRAKKMQLAPGALDQLRKKKPLR